MTVTLSIIKYPRRYIIFGFLSMAIFRLPLWLNRKLSFFKLMGSGKNGTFDIRPDLQQWALLIVWKDADAIADFMTGSFISRYWSWFGISHTHYYLEPLECHGKWDSKEPFGTNKTNSEYEGNIAVLTRATIRFNKLKAFWKNVNPVAMKMCDAKGFINSYGIGEMPWIKQATFSVWESKEDMRNFAYKMKEHADVIRKTRKENWYSEELFARFRVMEIKQIS
jgi:heme-degrading monooxygenase HmoA